LHAFHLFGIRRLVTCLDLSFNFHAEKYMRQKKNIIESTQYGGVGDSLSLAPPSIFVSLLSLAPLSSGHLSGIHFCGRCVHSGCGKTGIGVPVLQDIFQRLPQERTNFSSSNPNTEKWIRLLSKRAHALAAVSPQRRLISGSNISRA
jgi:hypothetical protein